MRESEEYARGYEDGYRDACAQITDITDSVGAIAHIMAARAQVRDEKRREAEGEPKASAPAGKEGL